MQYFPPIETNIGIKYGPQPKRVAPGNWATRQIWTAQNQTIRAPNMIARLIIAKIIPYNSDILYRVILLYFLVAMNTTGSK